MNQSELQIRKRIFYLFLIVVFIMCITVFRLAWIQIYRSDFYQQLALEQRLRKLKVEPQRGFIYDRTGEELAISGSADTIVALPPEIEDPEQVAAELDSVLSVEYDEIYELITRRAYAVYLARRVPSEKAERVRELDLTGISFTEESRRFYPKGSLAAHILGFTGVDNQGLNGLELTYDDMLRGTPGRIMVEKDAAGHEIPEGVERYLDANDGNDIHLTIDHVVQYIAERELENALQINEAEGGTILVMDPRDGSVLALANQPSYDPNNFAEYSPSSWRNAAVSDSYEPGSTFKIITASVGLEEGAVNVSDSFFCPGYIKVEGEKINCWRSGGHGGQSFAEVVANSCNPGFVQVGQRVGRDDFYRYTKGYGFGDATRINLPGEARGQLYAQEEVGPVELATMSFGHGISVTPIQLTTAVSAVANNGVLLQPRLVDKIKDNEGEIIEKFEPQKVRQVVSEETSQTMHDLLEGVVTEGSGEKAQIPGYRVGGKTGTAKHYGVDKYDSSFIGIMPLDDPQLVILAAFKGVTSYPYYGSQVAAPVFNKVAKDVVRYLEIPPSEKGSQLAEDFEEVEIPDVEGLSLEEADFKLRELGLNFKIEGTGDEVVEQLPYAGAKVREGTTVILFTEDSRVSRSRYTLLMPDFVDMTLDEAEELASKLGLELESGAAESGLIVEQSFEPGVRVEAGATIEVKLQ
ncbi:penicillin-binding transpeptidase domain-containing protein [Fuchsiella alkaliacetigena]|uniref:penicillin-binding transpeptidase domain-containing protein n=1 Tax=Fuchsiella alkaliacetigena TaxID=957042 RepID=UPI00200AA609|nr:penicillin-binding transpeptidase domain-containing protein [Fuchsiella alkaliacetigena]MCK8823679.1 PASTA domain-containing protein [Fuchsiella alkaliacetigena]